MTLTFEPLSWQNGTPRSDRFHDIYRTRFDALAQAHRVFLEGCGLPTGWRQRPRFTLLETGFGLGLNFLATWNTWRRDPARGTQLHYISIEAYPVSWDDLHTALRATTAPDEVSTDPARPAASALLDLAEPLAPRWPTLKPGLNTWPLDAGQVTLTLCIGDVQDMLRQLDMPVDAVYLDGFSPALNPHMWSAQTLALVARRCQPGTRLSSYTVARPVRDALTQLGFAVQRVHGLPPKRHALQARYLGPPSPHGPTT